MGKELPLACKEKEGWSELLARIGDRVHQQESNSRDQRTEKSSVTRWYKDSKIEDTPSTSKVSRKAKRATARRASSPKGHRRDNKDRKQDRGDEGEDTTTRRSAQLLGIVFPSSYCSDNLHHYWIEVDMVSKGSLFRCKNCHKHHWLPSWFEDALKMGSLMKFLGNQEGYCKYLSHPSRRAAKMMIAKLQHLDKLSETITDKMEFAKLADKILSDKEYDKEVDNGY